MQTGKLITRDGQLVTTFTLPPFQLQPEVCMWGTRVFVLDEPFEQKPGKPAAPVWREACPWSVDASKGLESLREEPEAPPVDRSARVLADGSPVPEDESHREINPATGQQRDYVVLSAAERAKGFVRPVRQSYKHVGRLTDFVNDEHPSGVKQEWKQRAGGCGCVTTMGLAIAETYARDPKFYSGTFCCDCGKHLPLDEFVWMDGKRVTDEQVGS